MNRNDSRSIILGTDISTVSNFLSKLPTNVRRNTFRTMILLAVRSLEGKDVLEGALDNILGQQSVPVSQLYEAFASLLTFIQFFLKLPQEPVASDCLKEDLKELKFPEECMTDLANILYGPKRLALVQSIAHSDFYLKLEKFRWRIDITISSSVLSRVLEPSILFDIIFTNGERKTFELSISKFHQVRYNVASVLKEMELMEKKKLFKTNV